LKQERSLRELVVVGGGGGMVWADNSSCQDDRIFETLRSLRPSRRPSGWGT